MKARYTILTLALLFTPAAAQASEPFFCAQVFPCDSEGNLLPQYLDPSSQCFDYYASQCKAQLEANQKNILCAESSQEVEKLQAQITRLKRKLKRRSRTQRRVRGS